MDRASFQQNFDHQDFQKLGFPRLNGAAVGSRPSWIKDLHRILTLWKHQLEQLGDGLELLRKDFQKRVKLVDKNLTAMESQISDLEKNQTAMEIRISKIEKKLTAMDIQISTLEKEETAMA